MTLPGRSITEKQAGLPRQDVLHPPPTRHTSAGRHRSTQHSWHGTESCQGTNRPSLHRQPLRGPRRHEALPSLAARRRTGSVAVEEEPCHSREVSHPPPDPGLSSLLCRGGADGRHHTASPRTAGKAQGRFKALKASRGWLRNAGEGRKDTGTR